jgi:tRNA(Ile)-lysidine synthase
MEVIRAESGFVEEAAKRWLGTPISSGFEEIHPALQRRIIQLQLQRLAIRAEFDLVEKLRLQPCVPVTVAPESLLVRDAGGTVVRRKAARTRFISSHRVIELDDLRGKFQFDRATISWSIGPWRVASRGLPRFGKRLEFFDADSVRGRVRVRHWRPGDRFQPIGLKASVKLQNLLVNAKVPAERRRNLIVAEAGTGELFWVEGLRISERFKLDKGTVRRLEWKWCRD